MRLARKPFHCLPAVVLCIAASASWSVFAESTAVDGKDEHHQHASQDWPGIYNGVTPCADCAGVKTTLALNKNGSYMLMTQFLGKSEREFTEKGKFSSGENANVLVLTPKNGSKSQQYLVEKDALVQLDANGNRFTGKQAERYTLRRTNFTDTAPAQGGHSGH